MELNEEQIKEFFSYLILVGTITLNDSVHMLNQIQLQSKKCLFVFADFLKRLTPSDCYDVSLRVMQKWMEQQKSNNEKQSNQSLINHQTNITKRFDDLVVSERIIHGTKQNNVRERGHNIVEDNRMGTFRQRSNLISPSGMTAIEFNITSRPESEVKAILEQQHEQIMEYSPSSSCTELIRNSFQSQIKWKEELIQLTCPEQNMICIPSQGAFNNFDSTYGHLKEEGQYLIQHQEEQGDSTFINFETTDSHQSKIWKTTNQQQANSSFLQSQDEQIASGLGTNFVQQLGISQMNPFMSEMQNSYDHSHPIIEGEIQSVPSLQTNPAILIEQESELLTDEESNDRYHPFYLGSEEQYYDSKNNGENNKPSYISRQKEITFADSESDSKSIKDDTSCFQEKERLHNIQHKRLFEQPQQTNELYQEQEKRDSQMISGIEQSFIQDKKRFISKVMPFYQLNNSECNPSKRPEEKCQHEIPPQQTGNCIQNQSARQKILDIRVGVDCVFEQEKENHVIANNMPSKQLINENQNLKEFVQTNREKSLQSVTSCPKNSAMNLSFFENVYQENQAKIKQLALIQKLRQERELKGCESKPPICTDSKKIVQNKSPRVQEIMVDGKYHILADNSHFTINQQKIIKKDSDNLFHSRNDHIMLGANTNKGSNQKIYNQYQINSNASNNNSSTSINFISSISQCIHNKQSNKQNYLKLTSNTDRNSLTPEPTKKSFSIDYNQNLNVESKFFQSTNINRHHSHSNYSSLQTICPSNKANKLKVTFSKETRNQFNYHNIKQLQPECH